MKKHKKEIVGLVGAAALIAVSALFPAAAANAASSDCASGHFCAWDNSNYTTMLVDSTYTGASKIEVGDDITSSGYNHRSSGNLYCGYTTNFPFPDAYVYQWPAGTAAVLPGVLNDRIDHFYYKASC